MGELLMDVESMWSTNRTASLDWENTYGLALDRPQCQIPPSVLLLLIGAQKVGVKVFLVYSRW